MCRAEFVLLRYSEALCSIPYNQLRNYKILLRNVKALLRNSEAPPRIA